MQPPVLSTKKIRTLRRELQQRRYAVPKLQRNFVWDAGRAAKLLDSIYRNIPVGSIFLWEMERKSAHLIRQSAEALPAFNPLHQHIQFVIDGQQRLSVLHQVFEGGTRRNDKGRLIHFERVCFDAKPAKDDNDAPRVVYRKPSGDHYVPLKDILAVDWRSRMPSNAKGFTSEIVKCRARILGYPLPVVTVKKATLEEIGEVFIRVNSQGMRITSVDKAIALMGEVDIRAMAEDVRRRVAERVFALESIDPILMGFNLVHEKPVRKGVPPKLDVMARRWAREIQNDKAALKTFKTNWHRYQRAFLSAVDYLHTKFPVHNETYLPSANMLATIAVFFYHHKGQPNAKQKREIRKWFWATGVAQRYSGRGYHRNLVADAQFFTRLALGKRGGFKLRHPIDPDADLRHAGYSTKSAVTRAYFCLLAASRPRYLDNGEPINLSGHAVSHANQKHRHHVFPVAQLRGHMPSSAYNSLCNICFLVSQDNLAIGMKLPSSYLAAYRDENRRQFRRVMKSHLIPVDLDSGVWQSGAVEAYKKFQDERLALICAAFERQAGMDLFVK